MRTNKQIEALLQYMKKFKYMADKREAAQHWLRSKNFTYRQLERLRNAYERRDEYPFLPLSDYVFFIGSDSRRFP